MTYQVDKLVALFKRLGSMKFKVSNKNLMTQCPFGLNHSDGKDTNPSFGVHLDSGIFHCFSCNRAGHISSLLSEDEKNDFVVDFRPLFAEALLKLDKKSGVEEACLHDFDFNNLDYCIKRGISANVCRLFEVGFDNRTNRIIFVIRDKASRLVALQGRSVDDSEPKYQTFFGTQISNCLYRIDLFKGLDIAILVEGVFDVLNLFQHGYTNVLGTFGAHVSDKQLELLDDLGIKTIICFFDNDVAGDFGYNKLCLEFKGHVIRVKADSDPAELDKDKLDKVLDIAGIKSLI